MQQDGQIVYIVDDEQIIAQTLAMILAKAGFKATAFDDPVRALDAAENEPPQLLITDVMMPGMTGIELAIRVRDRLPECKIILFSGKAATADLLEKARSQGYDFELLSKPVHPTDLLAKLESYSQESRA